jgi:serine-type D-Ala-D-Ala carboxypeptidase (penicillin-binding protein 5/6)
MSQLILKPSVVGLYLHEMNQTARKIGLSRSSWANPHGLSNVNNVSTAEDMAQLCMFAMKNTQFREVVSTKIYNCTYYFEKEL